jgi:radical SAM/Cys-rich protein
MIIPFEQMIPRPLLADGIETLQINVGYRCNLECRHCHIEAGPNRHELMPEALMMTCLQILKENPIPSIDITGGSPEMHSALPWFLEECGTLKRRLQVRTNGVILIENEFAVFPDLYARNRVEVVVSFPHVDLKMTDRQRGNGVYFKLIEALQKLNERGYGQKESGLILNLVHNPSGAYLPGSQSDLENHYRRVLKEKFGIAFNHLFCITNMPIGRYLTYLRESDNYDEYMATLINAFNPINLESIMCKKTLSVAWDGKLYDCDFNQILGMTVNHGAPENISAFDLPKLSNRQIVTGNHCYGCTAGAGSSCAGALAEIEQRSCTGKSL